jgi:hypothetical protein
MPKRTDPPSFHVRLPPELLQRVKLAAVENRRSFNEEFVWRIASTFELAENDRRKATRLAAELLAVLEDGG